MRKKITWGLFVLSITVFLMSGCAGGSREGFIALQIENVRGPAAFQALTVQGKMQEIPDPLKVTQFRVTITGEGIATPIVATADGEAKQIEVLGIPVGPARKITIEAFNTTGDVIRRRELNDVKISGGIVTPIKTSLNTIPVILAPKPGSVVLADKFKVVGFGEPGGSLRVESSSANESISLNESVGGPDILISPSLSTGLFEFKPESKFMGRQKITLTDEATGESSSVTVSVVEGKDRPGRQIVPAGAMGTFTTIGTGIGGQKAANFPLVLKTLGQTLEGE